MEPVELFIIAPACALPVGTGLGARAGGRCQPRAYWRRHIGTGETAAGADDETLLPATAVARERRAAGRDTVLNVRRSSR